MSGRPLRELPVDVGEENVPNRFVGGEMMRRDGTDRSAPDYENLRAAGADAVEPRVDGGTLWSMSLAGVGT